MSANVNIPSNPVFSKRHAWVLLCVLLFIYPHLNAQTNAIDWAKKTVTSTMSRNPGGNLGYWKYWNGFYLLGQYRAWQITKDTTYFIYIKNWVDSHVDNNGAIDQPLVSLDDFQPGLITLMLYRETQEQRYRLAADRIRDVIKTYPKVDGGFQHTIDFTGQLWLDGTFMALPFLVEYGSVVGDTACLTEAANQILIYASHLGSPSGLLYHGYDEDGSEGWADPVTHHSPYFWGRSMGWFGMAMVEILDYLPSDHPLRPQVIQVLANLIEGLSQVQDETTGLWYQVVDKGDSAGNWLESSCSCMYAYFMDKAVEKGYVGNHYRTIARKAYEGILSNKAYLGSDGLINLADISKGTSVSADYDYYIDRERGEKDLHGLGAFLMMCLQMAKSEPSQAWNLTVTVDPPGAGSVSPAGGTYPDGEVIDLLAVPANVAYAFDHWNDDPDDILPGKTITMNGDQVLSAHFRAVSDSVIIVEAETGTISLGTVDANWPEFTGTGFVNLENQIGTYLVLDFSLPMTGDWEFRIRYANASLVNRPCAICIDGQKDTLDFSPNGGWTSWTYSDPVSFNLTAGSHSVTITGLTFNSAPNMDHVKFVYGEAVSNKGVIMGQIHAPGGQAHQVDYTATLYDASWNPIGTQQYPGIEWGDPVYSFDSLFTGDYHVMAYARVIQWVDPPYHWNKYPWIETYYSDAVSQAGAETIHVVSSDTTKNINVTLRYASLVQVGTDPPGYPVTVDAVAFSTDSTFVWKEGDVHAIGVEEFYENAAGGRSYFTGWKQGGERVQNYTVPSGIYNTVVDSLIARFEYRYQLDVQVNDTSMGSVTVIPAGEWQIKNATVSLTAAPRLGNKFVEWDGDVADPSSITTTVTMNANKAVTAIFAVDTSKGAIQLTVDYHQMAFHRGWYFIILYNTRWVNFKMHFCSQLGESFVIEGITPGDYYLKTSPWVEDCGVPNEYRPCNDPYISEFYNDTLDSSAAAIVHVSAGDTTVLDPIWIDTEYETYLVTSPDNLSGEVDGSFILTTPAYLSWMPGETHTVGFDDAYPRSDGSRYVFNSWKHGGDRIQQYTKPAGVLKDTLEARFDLIYEAESGTLSQGTVDTEWPGFTGTGYVNLANATGTNLAMSLSISKSGDWNICFRYANASVNNRPCEISVDGQKDTLEFPPTGDWATWAYSDPVSFNLTAGNHSLTIIGLTSESAPNIDVVKIKYVNSLARGAIMGRVITSIAFYDFVSYEMTLYDISWRPIHSQSYSREEVIYNYAFWDIPSGDYYIKADAQVVGWHWPYAPYVTKEVWVETYYPNSIDHAGAIPVHVNAPDTTNGVNFTLRNTSIIHVGTEPPNYPVTVDGVAGTGNGNFLWKEGDTHSIGVEEYYENSDGSRSYFMNWRQGGERSQHYTVPPGIFGFVVDSLIARFEYRYQSAVQVNDTSMGSVTVIPAGEWQIKNATVSLKAVPKQGFRFDGWEGDFTETGDSITVVMDTSKVLVARFALIGTSGMDMTRPVPMNFTLMQNYPNPFNAETHIHYGIPKTGQVILSVYGLNGSCIRTLVDEEHSGGFYDAVWDGRDDGGNPVSSGIYLFRLQSGDRVFMKKMVLVK